MNLVEKLLDFVEKTRLSSEKKEKFNTFLKAGFPTTKDEEWKYTSLKKIVSQDYNINEIGGKISLEKIKKYSLGIDDKIIFIDGTLVSQPTIKNISISNYTNFESNESDSISKLNSSLSKNGYTISRFLMLFLTLIQYH